jgi:flagellar secretion chaperone FliS
MTPTELVYRKTAAEGAGGFGLLIALYDTLAGDLRRAAEAERRNDIGKRCREVNHALTVIGFLEDRCERGDGGELAQKLAAFYASLRRKLLEAQARRSPEILEEQMALGLSIRGTWQDIEVRTSAVLNDPPAPQPAQLYPGAATAQDDRNVLSWSA